MTANLEPTVHRSEVPPGGLAADADERVVRPADRRGAVVLSLFGLVWASAGTSALPSPATWIGLGAAALGTALVIVTARRAGHDSTDDPRPGWQRLFFRVAMLQGAAIAVAVALLATLDRGELIPPTVCFIVGLHFVPLAALFEQPLYRYAAASLWLVALAGFLVAVFSGAVAVQGVVGIGAATVLCVTALLLVHPPPRQGHLPEAAPSLAQRPHPSTEAKRRSR